MHYGNHLGMVINSSDPEYRGRVQIFVPHVMPTLYDGWNKEGEDIEISCVGSNIPQGLSPELHARLVKILPWAEAASPIVGSSSPGSFFSDLVQGAKTVAGAAAGALESGVSAAKSYFSQTPTSSPVPSSGASGEDLANSAKNLIGTSTANLAGTDGGNLGCAAAVSLMFKKATGQDIVPGQTVVTGTTQLYSHMSKSSDYVEVPIDQMQPGDILVTPRNFQTGKAGHTGIYVGDGRIVSNSSSGFMGSERGTIQNNYNVDSWKKGVVSRNPGGSGVFRYVGLTSTSTDTPKPATGDEQTSASGTSASPNPIANAQATTSETAPTPQTTITAVEGAGISGTVSGGGTVSPASLAVGANGKVDPQQLKSYIEQRIANSKLNNYVPADAAKYGVDGSPKSWANYFTKLSEKESGFNASQTYTESFSNSKGERVVSTGLFQVSYESVRGYGVGKGMSDQELNSKLSDPMFNIDAAIAIHERNVLRDGKLEVGGGKGAGGYFASASMRKIAADVTAGKVDSFDASATASSPQQSVSSAVVNNTDSNGRTPVVNTNDMANGLFTFPKPGSMVWVFFREGNPLFPVYFAASYSSAEWSSAYRGGSKSEYDDHETPGVDISTTNMKLNPSGGLLAKNRLNLNDPLDNESVFSLYHGEGSNITFKNGCDFHYSKNNKRDEVESDRFVVTKGYKEQWVEGDESSNVRGNVIVKIGKIDQEAIDAMNELADFNKELSDTLKQNS